MEISSSMVEFSGGSPKRKTQGYWARPEKAGKYPGVIVIQEIWGLVDHIKDVSRRFAKEGYVALAVDLFEGETASDLETARGFGEKFTEEKILADLKGGFDYLTTLQWVNPKRIGCIGFCMGGGLSLLFACRNPDLAAAVVFYGRNPSPIDQLKNINCPVLCNYAGADYGITESDINLFEETLTKYGKIFDVKVYHGAPHAFFNDTRPSYRPDAAKDAWERALKFYDKYLKE